MSAFKSRGLVVLSGAVAALTLGAALAASAQVKAPGFTGHGPVTPPEDPGLCMAKNVMNPNKWSICGVTPPKNRDITVSNAQGHILKARFTTPGGTDVEKTLASGQQATIPIATDANATIVVNYITLFGTSHACTVHSAEHGSGNILISVSLNGLDPTCTVAP